jgi:hypothetical protein
MLTAIAELIVANSVGFDIGIFVAFERANFGHRDVRQVALGAELAQLLKLRRRRRQYGGFIAKK